MQPERISGRNGLATCRAKLGVAALLMLSSAACQSSNGTEAANQNNGQPSEFAARDLLERSTTYHDPQGVWAHAQVDAQLELERPGQLSTNFQYSHDPNTGSFHAASISAERRITWQLEPESWNPGVLVFGGSVDGRRDFTAAERAEFKVTRERAELWRDYYGFLLGLPMKVAEAGVPGARLVDDIRSETFAGRSVLVLRVEYSEPIGDDTWDFFLDPKTCALVGCRFFKADPDDGETLVFEGEIRSEGVRLPALRRWYVTATDELLGSDRIQTLAIDV